MVPVYRPPVRLCDDVRFPLGTCKEHALSESVGPLKHERHESLVGFRPGPRGESQWV